ncbi:MAG: Hsp33 family molecular chaperone HslO [Candidatus Methylumidiphilus sp.]
MGDHDCLLRFVFEDLGVRGELVRLDASWRAVLERHAYPEIVKTQLGQALATVVLLSATVKFEGALILQAQGEGPLHTLVAQATHQRTLRGLARWHGEGPAGGGLAEVFGAGRLVLTLQREGAEPYQGIVGLEGANLAEAVQTYFTHSEQLPTRLWLAADNDRATGLMLQELPGQYGGSGGEGEAWSRLTLLADTVTERELLLLPAETLLYRLFNEEDVSVFEPEPVAFRCSCSRERIESVLRSLGRAEAEAGLAENGRLDVGCEFCNRRYGFDAVDVHALFATDLAAPGSRSKH